MIIDRPIRSRRPEPILCNHNWVQKTIRELKAVKFICEKNGVDPKGKTWVKIMKCAKCKIYLSADQ